MQTVVGPRTHEVSSSWARAFWVRAKKVMNSKIGRDVIEFLMGRNFDRTQEEDTIFSEIVAYGHPVVTGTFAPYITS